MDRAIFKGKVDNMLPDLTKALQKECLRLFDSGGIDTSKYDTNYILPKIVLSVAIKNQVIQYRPLYKQHSKDIKNLESF